MTKQTEAQRMRSFLQTIADAELPFIEDVQVWIAEERWSGQLNEGQWIPGRFASNIRIDQPTHLAGQGSVHAHVQGRKGKDYVIVNMDGTASHGMRGRLHKKDADALRARNFVIPTDNIIEWYVPDDAGQILLFG